MKTDWGLIAAVWAFGWACGALTWYWVLKLLDGDKSGSHADEKR